MNSDIDIKIVESSVIFYTKVVWVPRPADPMSLKVCSTFKASDTKRHWWCTLALVRYTPYISGKSISPKLYPGHLAPALGCVSWRLSVYLLLIGFDEIIWNLDQFVGHVSCSNHVRNM